jgi:hypothetical protein
MYKNWRERLKIILGWIEIQLNELNGFSWEYEEYPQYHDLTKDEFEWLMNAPKAIELKDGDAPTGGLGNEKADKKDGDSPRPKVIDEFCVETNYLLNVTLDESHYWIRGFREFADRLLSNGDYCLFSEELEQIAPITDDEIKRFLSMEKKVKI